MEADALLYILIVFDLIQVGLIIPNFVAMLREMFNNKDVFSPVDRACINETNLMVRDIKTKTDELTEMHDRRDENGLPLWYVKKSIYDDIAGIRRSLAMMEIYNKMAHQVGGSRHMSRAVSDDEE